ncbi:hypothetical protein D5S18_02330 [Nocardia panacis]|uniref:Uncharacterized protein n=2 Tax=Nocardia panacis TaxID=2340916 RepID=A0A3A4L829_9NOCA|nr:hypothetical protein D5S18_02330 [Nocardia panacis]
MVRREGRAVRKCRSSAEQERQTAREHKPAQEVSPVDARLRGFVERALRLLLEVLDLRRPIGQLGAVAEPTVVAAVRTLLRLGLVPGRQLGVAMLTRVDIAMVTRGAVEVSAAYDRGARHFALAARMQQTRPGWRLSAVRLR